MHSRGYQILQLSKKRTASTDEGPSNHGRRKRYSGDGSQQHLLSWLKENHELDDSERGPKLARRVSQYSEMSDASSKILYELGGVTAPKPDGTEAISRLESSTLMSAPSSVVRPSSNLSWEGVSAPIKDDATPSTPELTSIQRDDAISRAAFSALLSPHSEVTACSLEQSCEGVLPSVGSQTCSTYADTSLCHTDAPPSLAPSADMFIHIATTETLEGVSAPIEDDATPSTPELTSIQRDDAISRAAFSALLSPHSEVTACSLEQSCEGVLPSVGSQTCSTYADTSLCHTDAPPSLASSADMFIHIATTETLEGVSAPIEDDATPSTPELTSIQRDDAISRAAFSALLSPHSEVTACSLEQSCEGVLPSVGSQTCSTYADTSLCHTDAPPSLASSADMFIHIATTETLEGVSAPIEDDATPSTPELTSIQRDDAISRAAFSALLSPHSEVTACSLEQSCEGQGRLIPETLGFFGESELLPLNDNASCLPHSEDELPFNLSDAACGEMGRADDSITQVQQKKDPQANKIKKQRGAAYVNRKGVPRPAPEFQFIRCRCRNDCDKVTEEERRNLFHRYWNLASWDAQSVYLRMSIKEVPVKSHGRTPIEKQRAKVLIYTVGEHQVCKAVFISTYGIEAHRVNYLVDKKTKAGITSPDKRGRREPANKIPDETLHKISSFLDEFPKYRSHYGTSEKLYFHPHLSVAKLFELYIEKNPTTKVSSYIFRKVFRERNIKIYVPKTDTCSTCDYHEAQRKGELTDVEKNNLEKLSKEHIGRAEAAREELRRSTKASKENKRILCFSFDLQKTLPLPYINTSDAFYKRQMWIYNLGINDRSTNKAYMCLWTEIEGKRGSNEIASSILAFLNSLDLSQFDEIRTFSDGCGGQNRNRTMLSFFMHICSTTPIKTWTHCFLESGHSFLPNDTDFGKIEKAKRARCAVYSYEQWAELVKRCRFDVIPMGGSFFDVSELCLYHTFRHQDCEGDKFNWLRMKWCRVTGDDEAVQYKHSCSPDEAIKFINFAKKNKISTDHEFRGLYVQPIPLQKKKYDDVQSLLKFIPYVYSQYFIDLPHNGTATNDYELYPDSEDENQ